MNETGQRWGQRLPRTMCWLGQSASAVGLALLGAHSPFADAVQSGWRTLGFDAERVLLLTLLTMALLGTMGAAGVQRARGAAWAGGVLFFVATYLVAFVWQSLQPLPDALGRPQVMVPGALGSVAVTLTALAVVGCGVGAVVGAALGELVVVPMFAIVRVGYRWWRGQRPTVTRSQVVRQGIRLGGGIMVLLAVWLCLINAGDLLTYGPSSAIFRPRIPATMVAQPHGTVQQGTYRSAALRQRQQTYWVYLPPAYFALPAQRYPVLYLLHGSPGKPSDWFRAAHVDAAADDLLARQQMRATILVGAEGNGPRYRFSEWANSADGRQRMEDAIAFDLVAVIDQRYRTRATAANRAIGGLSMGGYGAVNIALHHPDVFGTALSLGGYFTAEGAVFGTTASFRHYNSPQQFIQTAAGARALRQVRFIIGVGLADGTYYQQGLRFVQSLKEQGATVTLLVATGGHAWRVWAQQMAQAFPLIAPVGATNA